MKWDTARVQNRSKPVASLSQITFVANCCSYMQHIRRFCKGKIERPQEGVGHALFGHPLQSGEA